MSRSNHRRPRINKVLTINNKGNGWIKHQRKPQMQLKEVHVHSRSTSGLKHSWVSHFKCKGTQDFQNTLFLKKIQNMAS